MFRDKMRKVINQIGEVLDSNLSDDKVIEALDKHHDELKALLTEAYHERVRLENERKQKATNAKMEKLGLGKCTYDEVQKWEHITYSAFETFEYGDHKTKPWIVWNNLPLLAVEGECVVVAEAGWDGDGKEYRSEPIVNPTYEVLASHADKSVAVTKDHHHIFFEGFRVKTKNGIKEVHLSFGS